MILGIVVVVPTISYLLSLPVYVIERKLVNQMYPMASSKKDLNAGERKKLGQALVEKLEGNWAGWCLTAGLIVIIPGIALGATMYQSDKEGVPKPAAVFGSVLVYSVFVALIYLKVITNGSH
jgi:hypothetical protein